MTTESDSEQIVRDFLGGNWYDRPESDEAIVREFVRIEDPEHAKRTIAGITAFLSSSQTDQEKALVIRDSAWRHLPDGPDAPVYWLRGTLAMLQTEMRGSR